MYTTTLHSDSYLPPPVREVYGDGTVIRLLAPIEIDAVRSLCRYGSFGSMMPAHALEPEDGLKRDWFCWVAEFESRIVGFAIGWEQSGDVAHLCHVCVHSQFQGHGIAMRLARAALNSIRESGCLKVVLYNVAAADRAVEIMEQSGFVFNRHRDHCGDACLEFYVDLYANAPGQIGSHPSAAIGHLQ
jgi:ribosomal protein S18 acetylase RimI-like enzyme